SRALPDGQLQVHLSAFLLAHQQQCVALLGLSRAGETLFKFEIQPDANGLLQPFFATRDFYEEDLLKAGQALIPTAVNTVKISEIEPSPHGAYLWLVAPLHTEGKQIVGALAAKLRAEQLLLETVGPHNKAATSVDEHGSLTWRESLVLSPQ